VIKKDIKNTDLDKEVKRVNLNVEKKKNEDQIKRNKLKKILIIKIEDKFKKSEHTIRKKLKPCNNNYKLVLYLIKRKNKCRL
jgi:hypothetical protein